MKAIADVECSSVGQEIGDPESSRQDEVEPAGLFRNLSGEIGPKGASGKFSIGPDSVQCGEAVFDFRGEAEAMSEKRFLELDVDHLRADRDLPAIPLVAHWVSDGHHPGGHEGRAFLLGCVVLGETMGEHIAGAESDFLCADGDRGPDICGMHAGRSHEEPKNECGDDSKEKWHVRSTSISCRPGLRKT